MNKLLTAFLLMASVSASAAQRVPFGPGKFYPRKLETMRAMVDRFLAEAPSKRPGRIVALLVPHAGLEFTGPSAAKAFRLIRRRDYKRVIIIGAAHRSTFDGAAIYPGAYGTPDGDLPFDRKAAEALLKASPLISMNAAAHDGEHAIEMQIPFLRRRLGDIPQVSLIMSSSDLDAAREIGRAIAAVARTKKTLIVISSDMSQFSQGETADRVDRTTLAAMGTVDPAFFWLTNRLILGRDVPHLSKTFCGEGAVIAGITAARALGAGRLHVIEHINSGDVVSERDYHHVVGYAAAAFLKGVRGRDSLRLDGEDKRALIAAARSALRRFAAKKTLPPGSVSKNELFNLPAAAFVTLRAPRGALRGRSGDAVAQRSLADAIDHHAVQAAFFDPKGGPLSPADIESVSIEITLLSDHHLVTPREVVSGRGVSLDLRGKSALLMPDEWKKFRSRRSFLEMLCTRQAGMRPDCYKDKDAVIKTFLAESFSSAP